MIADKRQLKQLMVCMRMIQEEIPPMQDILRSKHRKVLATCQIGNVPWPNKEIGTCGSRAIEF